MTEFAGRKGGMGEEPQHIAPPTAANLETGQERRRRQRREYHQRRTTRTAGGQEHGRRWTVADARIALNTGLTVPEAARQLSRSASAVESLRKRWRNGTLPIGLADQVPRPPKRPDADSPTH
ncbi:hypothetical protein ACNQRL_00140 [Mycolicibacterium fortuitum]